MYRATTPKHIFGFPFSKLAIKDLLITYSQNDGIVLEKRLADGKFTMDGKFEYELTQEEASLFKDGIAMVQARVKNENGNVLASNIIYFEIKNVLNDEVF